MFYSFIMCTGRMVGFPALVIQAKKDPTWHHKEKRVAKSA